jgi:3-dehydroquinate dehydratase / shikimate dehydrogenase
MSVGPDRVCAVVARTRHKMMQVELQEAAKAAQFVEVRLDFLAKAVDFKRLQPHKKCAWMATLRRPADGGRWPGSEQERQMVLRQAVVSGCFEWIDLETDVAETIRRFGAVKRVVSYHNLIETPPDLDVVYDQMLKQDADVYKLAVMPRTATDLARIVSIQKRATKPTICFGMGDFGFPTRFTSLKFGAPWIYALFNKDRELAPGMPSLSDFRTIYPVWRIDADTKFYALFGDPVAQSLSPILHNHLFLRNKVNAVYLPFRVPDGHLKETVTAMTVVPMAGYSVTIPHKEAAAALAADAEPMVPQVGAANTLLNRPDGTYYAANTDYPAAMESLRTHLDQQAEERNAIAREFAQMHALILGAGGAARAVAFALHRAGANVTIAARSTERAKRLADDVGCKYTDWAARHNVTPCDIAVNCTPVGMHPNVDESPLHVSFLRPDLVVFDTVYNPEQTLLLREAKNRGCGIVNGVDMFVRQAAKQFELFTGITPNLDAMRELMRKAMSPLTKAMEEEAVKSGMIAQPEPN